MKTEFPPHRDSAIRLAVQGANPAQLQRLSTEVKRVSGVAAVNPPLPFPRFSGTITQNEPLPITGPLLAPGTGYKFDPPLPDGDFSLTITGGSFAAAVTTLTQMTAMIYTSTSTPSTTRAASPCRLAFATTGSPAS